jgi:UDP-N-acetylmuramoyl-tripeptide--D-alanyl-D-alanine ligase
MNWASVMTPVRRQSRATVVGITGSTGKTIAKEMVADVLSRAIVTLRNEGNLNSETGLPMTLLRLRPEHEVGMRRTCVCTCRMACPHPGEEVWEDRSCSRLS